MYDLSWRYANLDLLRFRNLFSRLILDCRRETRSNHPKRCTSRRLDPKRMLQFERPSQSRFGGLVISCAAIGYRLTNDNAIRRQ